LHAVFGHGRLHPVELAFLVHQAHAQDGGGRRGDSGEGGQYWHAAGPAAGERNDGRELERRRRVFEGRSDRVP
jgi:hypothetical protein